MWHTGCMARPRRIDPELVVKARAAVAQAADAKTLRAAQAVLMPALAHTTLEQTAALLGVGRASVPRLQRRFREGLQLVRSSPSWGGRRRALRRCQEFCVNGFRLVDGFRLHWLHLGGG